MNDLADEVDRPPVPADEVWRIRDDSAAGFALRDIARDQAELARLEAVARDEKERIGQWLADESRPVRDRIQRRTDQLIDYRRQLEDADPDLPKTYKLPNGNLTRRAQPVRTVIDNEDALIAWAEEHDPDLLRRKVEIDKTSAAWKTYVVDGEHLVDPVTGLKVEGAHSEKPDDTYAVKAVQP